jgi:serine/threonine-protein kinase
MSVICPRCNADHDGKSDSRGFATCRQCAFVWQLNAKPPSEPVLRKAKTDYGRSDEYAPLESDAQPHTAPLTMREGAQPSGKHPVVSPLPPPEAKAKGTPRSAPQPPIPGDLDSQLFERMEQQAVQRRSNQETMVQPSSSSVRKHGTARHGAVDQGTCPVCGHRFALVGNPPTEMQTCPQCSTSFNLRNGQLASEGSEDTTGGDPLIGRTIRGCFIDRKVGEGGMGSVYHARQLSLDRSVAIKVMPAELARNKNFIQRFEREAKSLARINHPNILHIYDFGEESALGIYFMIIEFVDGKDLGEVLRTRETISQEEMLDILRQALLGLEMASEKGVIHRDIKPDNLMIAKDGICKVSDFGLAKGYGAFDEVTTAGVRVGTPAFMSPEQCDGIEVDARSDVYSLGCTVYLALTGFLPFGGDSPFSIMLKHKTDPPPSLRTHRPEIDRRMDELVRRMLAKRPDDRCRKLRELIDQVEDLQVALSGGSSRRSSTGGERSKALHESGAAKLLPETSDPGLPAVEDLSGAQASTSLPPAHAMPPLPPPTPAPARRSASSSMNLPPADFSLQPVPVREQSSSAILDAAAAKEEPVHDGRVSSAVRSYQDAIKRRSSRDQGAKIADARKQQRHEDGLAIEARGDQMAAAGREDEAIDEWMRAAQASSQVARREDLLRKVGNVQHRKRRRSLLRRSLILLSLFMLAVVGAFAATPEVHRRLAQRELLALAGLPAAERLAELDAFIDRTKPYAWYLNLFRSEYDLPAVADAQAQRVELAKAAPVEAPPSSSAIADRERKFVEQLGERAKDAHVTWKQLESDAASLRPLIRDQGRRAQVDAIAAQAAAGLQAVEQGLAAIDAARQAGHHADALALAAEFPASNPRAGNSVSLPAPGRLEVAVEGHQGPIEDLRVSVDGVVLADHPEVFCRDPSRATTIEVSAPGYLAERRSIPPGSGPAPLAVQLKPGRLWQVRLNQMGPWWSLESHDSEHVLIIGARAFLTVRLSDGAVLQAIDRRALPVPPVGFDPGWTMFQEETPERVLVATSDGVVARLSWDPAKGLGMRELVRKGAVGVTAFLERELVLQPGRRAQIEVEAGAAGAELAAWVGQDQLWRVKNLVSTIQPPFLTATEERICLVDDQAVHLFEEDGASNGGYELATARTGRVVVVGHQDAVLAIPTMDGVELLRLGGQPHFLEPLHEPNLGKIGQASVAGSGDDLLVADLLGGVRLFRASDGALRESWKASLPQLRKPIGQVLLTAAYAVVVDDSNTIHLFSRADGSVVRRYEHPLRPVLAPLPIGRALVILDPGGQLTAYNLPE